MYKTMGDYARAEPLYRQAMEIRKQVLGEKHPDYAVSLNNLAELYEAMGDGARAEPLLRQSLQIELQTFGVRHPQYATSLNNLALLYYGMGDDARAETLFLQVLQIRKQTLGERHPDYATSLNCLARLYSRAGNYQRAEPLYRQALEILKQKVGEKHPDYATDLNNLASLYEDRGDYARAEPLYRQSLEIYKKTLGERHVYYAGSLNNLAMLWLKMNRPQEAVAAAAHAVDIVRAQLDATADVQSESQQLAMNETLRWCSNTFSRPPPPLILPARTFIPRCSRGREPSRLGSRRSSGCAKPGKDNSIQIPRRLAEQLPTKRRRWPICRERFPNPPRPRHIAARLQQLHDEVESLQQKPGCRECSVSPRIGTAPANSRRFAARAAGADGFGRSVAVLAHRSAEKE